MRSYIPYKFLSAVAALVLLAGCSGGSAIAPKPFTPDGHGVAQRNETPTGAAPAGPPTHYVVLYRFQGGADGGKPLAGLVRDAAGNLYGTTERGGSASCPNGCGVVFKVDPSGHESVLHAFTGPDGKLPEAGLLLDAAGNLYGTTAWGGPSHGGTIFKLDPGGIETVLHGFQLNGIPTAELIFDGTYLFGTAEFGGARGLGSVFVMDLSGNYTDMYSFNSTDGYGPSARLARDSSGNLYGTTIDGGSGQCRGLEHCGIVFKVTPSGSESILHAFTFGSDGSHPNAGVLRDAAGNLYGSTRAGGSAGGCSTTSGCGVVFKLDPSGNETILFRFKGKSGENPLGDLVRTPEGNFYGTTSRGGSLGFGVVFKLDSNGSETVLHSFDSADGGPVGGVIRDDNGNLYGTAQYPSSNGVVFKLVH